MFLIQSTLLDILADRKLIGMWSGDIYINGVPRQDDFRLRTAYVLQDDVLISTLTVAETLYYSAWTRVASIKTEEQLQERVNTLLKMMGLDHVRNSIVGDAMHKGISGGQLKRLCIAVELVSLPDVIFLDEPTSGLDSSISLEVMAAVKNIVGPSKLCISTIHQPSPEVFALFDKLVLMCSGRLVYYGDTKEAVNYFTRPQLGYRYMKGTNPAEFVIAVGGGSQFPEGTKVPRQPEELEALFKASKFYQPMQLSKIRADPNAPKIENECTTFSTQLAMLMSRAWKAKIRDTADLKAQLMKNVFIGIMIGVVFYDQGTASEPFYHDNIPSSDVMTVNAILFFTLMFTMIGNLQAIPYLCSQNLVYRRELAANAYTPGPHWFSLLTCIIPLNFVYHFVFVITLYFLVGLNSSASYFFYYFWLLFFANTLGFYMAICVAAFTGSETLAFSLFPICFLFLSNFAGFAITIDDIPPLWCWAPYLSYARWLFEGLMVNQWENYDTDDQPVESGNGDILSVYSFNNFDKNDSFWIAFLYLFGLAGLTYYALCPEKKKLVKLEQGEMTASAAQSIYERKSAAAVKKTASISIFGGGSSILRESLLNESYHADEDDYLEPQVTYNVDFYRVSSGMIDKSDGCSVDFKNLVYTVTDKMDPTKKSVLLNGVTGHVLPGEMCALMGASGAGKSTLLDVLAGRKTTGEIEGSITFNDSPVLRSSAYVMQDNVHIGLLTVRQSLYFAAELRLPENWTYEKKNKRVDKILDMLGLTAVQNTIVGNHSIRGISGGQVKRLSIGVEIINLPNMMFLDEPTTGLDSSISLEVMSAVRNLANQNRTVICTIHQPSAQTFELFDTLLLLARGKVIYFGPVRDCVEYFMSSPYQFHYRPNSNPADYVVAVGGSFIPAVDGKHISGEELADYYITKKKGDTSSVLPVDPRYNMAQSTTLPSVGNMLTQQQKKDGTAEDEEFHDRPWHTSTFHQIKVLTYRAFLKTARDRRATVVATLRHILVSLFYGSIYFHLSSGDTSSAYTNRLGLFFFTLMFMIIGHQQAVPAMLDERLIFYRERGSKAYGALSYWVSSTLIQIPLIVFNVFIFSVILYYMVQLNNADGCFGYFYFMLTLTSFCGYFAACLISSIAPSTQAALSYYPIVLFFSVSFAGYLVYIPELPDWLGDWAPYISFMRYGFQGLTLNEFQGNADLSYQATYIDMLGFNLLDKTDCAGYLMMFVCIYAVSFLVMLKFVNFEER